MEAATWAVGRAAAWHSRLAHFFMAAYLQANGEQRGAQRSASSTIHKCVAPSPSAVKAAAVHNAGGSTADSSHLKQSACSHGVDLGLVLLLQRRALELEGGGEQVVLHGEVVLRRLDIDGLHLLKALHDTWRGGVGLAVLESDAADLGRARAREAGRSGVTACVTACFGGPVPLLRTSGFRASWLQH